MNDCLVVMLVVVLMAGCGTREQTGDAGTPATTRAPATAGADAVAAVLQSPGAPIAKLGFVVLATPVVGVQSALRLDVSAPAPIPALQLTGTADGLMIDAGTASASLALPTAGTAVSHELRFTPQHDGLTELTVRLRSDESGVETVYVVPVLVARAAAGG